MNYQLTIAFSTLIPMNTTTTHLAPKVTDKGLFRLTKYFGEHPLQFLTEYRDKHGPTYRANLVMREMMVTSDPLWMRYMLQTHHKDFGRGYAYQILKMALGEGLLVNEGESWMRQRRLAQPAFYKKRLNELFHVMEGEGNKMVQQLENKRGETISVTDLFWKVTSDIVISTLLGGKGFRDNLQMQEDITEMQEYLVDRIRNPIGIPWMYMNGRHRHFNRIIKRFDETIYAIIQERRASGESKNDLLSMLMDARDEDTGEQMSDKQLRDEFLTIYVAGHETSSYALSWTLYMLGTHPEAYRKVKEEVRSIPNIDEIGFEGLRQLPYINQAILESMRLYPPAWIAGRKVHATHEIEGIKVRKNGAVLLNIYGLHRDPNIWPEPDLFKPERFEPEAVKARDKFCYIPFGAGPRMCIGNNFALMEIAMLIAKLFYHFDLELVPDQVIEPDPLITLRPKNGIRMHVS